MAKYQSQTVELDRPRHEAYERLSDLSRLQGALDALPAEQREKLGDVRFEHDSITISTAQVGEIKFAITGRTADQQLIFGTPSSPVPLSLAVNLSDGADPARSQGQVVIDVDIPMMLKPLIGGKMQQAADQMANLIKLLC